MSNNEIKSWIEQIEFISKYDQDLANQINLIFNPIKIKYQNLLYNFKNFCFSSIFKIIDLKFQYLK